MGEWTDSIITISMVVLLLIVMVWGIITIINSAGYSLIEETNTTAKVIDKSIKEYSNG